MFPNDFLATHQAKEFCWRMPFFSLASNCGVITALCRTVTTAQIAYLDNELDAAELTDDFPFPAVLFGVTLSRAVAGVPSSATTQRTEYSITFAETDGNDRAAFPTRD